MGNSNSEVDSDTNVKRVDLANRAYWGNSNAAPDSDTNVKRVYTGPNPIMPGDDGSSED